MLLWTFTVNEVLFNDFGIIPQLKEEFRESHPNKNVLKIDVFQFGIAPSWIGKIIEEFSLAGISE